MQGLSGGGEAPSFRHGVKNMKLVKVQLIPLLSCTPILTESRSSHKGSPKVTKSSAAFTDCFPET
jgi:hypothetical protein